MPFKYFWQNYKFQENLISIANSFFLHPQNPFSSSVYFSLTIIYVANWRSTLLFFLQYTAITYSLVIISFTFNTKYLLPFSIHSNDILKFKAEKYFYSFSLWYFSYFFFVFQLFFLDWTRAWSILIEKIGGGNAKGRNREWGMYTKILFFFI